MSEHSAGTRRKARRSRKRISFVVGTLVLALGIVSPAIGAINLTLPGTTSPITLVPTVDLGSGNVAPNTTLDLSSATGPNLLGVTNLTGGLTQTGTSLTQLLNGLKGGAAVAAPVVQAKATEATATAITNLQNRAQNTIAAAAALDLQGAQDELLANVTDLQSQALGEVAGLLPLALTTGLSVAQNIVTPVCGLLAVPSSLIPGVGVDTTRLWTAAAPWIQQTDQNTNKLLRDSYSNLYDQALASVNNIPGVGPIASVLLTLLKYNWTTTYTPPGSTTPIVTTTKALMNVPTPIDVDNDGLFDLCGTTSFSLGDGGSISGIKFTQSITKMPLAKPVLPVQISGGLLNVLNFGYNTTESTAPIIYTTAASLEGSGLSIDNTYSVHRGKNLVIPPFSLAALNLTTGQLPTFPPLLTDAPKPIVTQEVCIGACSGIAIRDRFENVPATTHVDGPLASAGVKTNYSAPSEADSFSHNFNLSSSITLGASAGRDQTAADSATPVATTAPKTFSTCLSITDGTCSPNTAAGDKFSTSFTASSRTNAEQNLAIGGAAVNNCSGVAALGATTHILGTSFNGSAAPSTATVGSGRLALDTAGTPAEGCIAGGTVIALTGLPNYTLPTGFSANNRRATYHNTSTFGLLTGTPIDSKSGAITCPAGTSIGYSSISPLGTFVLAPVICSVPPVNTVLPAITGQALVESTITASNGTWTPGAPNTPTYTKQWLRCDGAGASCAPIAGATGDTYELQYGSYPDLSNSDFGKTFRVKVTATNLDGTASATSAQTPVVALPPPPVIATAPTLGANRKVGVATTTSNGTYTNGATSFTYKWQRCDAAGTPASCSDIAGETSSSYVVQAADKGLTIRSVVVGSNHGGSSAPNASLAVFIPPNPVNNTAPGIKSGATNAVGASVATGDNLSATAGTWDYTTSPFTYQWQRCDAGGSNCADIGGATSATYQLTHPADSGNTVRVVVTGHGLNGDTAKESGTTGVVLFNDLSAKNVTQIPDGEVKATAPGSGTTSYVGGSFDTVGAPTGGSGLIPDSGSGSTVSLASATAGATNGGVNATISDGAGGYFLGGSFTQVKGVQCPSLAHIVSDGSVDQNYCYSGLTGTVRSLTRANGAATKVLAVGGDFSYGGHNNLMFIDPTNTANPVYLAGGDPNGVVKTLSVNASTTVYFGGQFSQAGGNQAALLGSATLTFTSGQLSSVPRTNWSAGVCIGVPSGGSSACTDPAATVNTVAWLSSGFVAVGGRFDRNFRVVNNANPTNSATRSNALLVGESGASPTLLGWAPVIAGGAQTVNAIAPAVNNGGLSNIAIYVGGDFATVNGVAGTKNLAAVACSVIGSNVGSGANNNSAPMNTWLPNPNGAVTSLAWSGNASASTLIVGGAFTTIDSRPNTSTPFTTLTRHRLAKINIAGIASSTLPVVDANWDPNAGRTVRSVSRDAASGTVTVGGDFVVLGGQTRNNLAEIDPNTGVTSWNPSANDTVKALAFRSGTVYAGGDFTNVGGTARSRLAAIDGGSGAVTGWNPGADGAVNAIATDASNVYVGGAFANAGGAARANLAAIDGSGSATGWNPGTDGAVKALAIDSGNVYVGGAFANAGGAGRNNAAAIDGSGAATGFNPNADGSVNAIAVNGAGVYLGGAFTHLGGDARDHVGIVDPGTGAAGAWNPGVNGVLNAVYLIGSQVFVGGDFTTAGGASRSNLAALDANSDSALSFKPDPNGTVNSLSRTSGGSITVGGKFAIIAGQAAPALGFFGG